VSYLIVEYVPYEGQDVTEHDSLEELHKELISRSTSMFHGLEHIYVYEVSRELDVYTELEAARTRL